MARGGFTITIEHDGFEAMRDAFFSAAEALANAHVEFPEETEFHSHFKGIHFNGVTIARFRQVWTSEKVTVHYRPTAAISLWAGWVMAQLPSTARLSWREGWPYFTCRPNDDRAPHDDPSPLVPNELVPA